MTAMIEIARDMQAQQHVRDELNSAHKQSSLAISAADLKEVASFQYKFTVPLRDLCSRNSKRCLPVLKPGEDKYYIGLLRLPTFTAPSSASCFQTKQQSSNKSVLSTPQHLNDSTNYVNFSTTSAGKRKASTPYPILKSSSPTMTHKNFHVNSTTAPPHEQQRQQESLTWNSESRTRLLTSSLKYTRVTTAAAAATTTTALNSSASKSVKFKLTKYTRKITDEDHVVDDEEHFASLSKEISQDLAGDSAVKMEDAEFVPERKKLTFADPNDEPPPSENNVEEEEEKLLVLSVVEKCENEECQDVSMEYTER